MTVTLVLSLTTNLNYLKVAALILTSLRRFNLIKRNLWSIAWSHFNWMPCICFNDDFCTADLCTNLEKLRGRRRWCSRVFWRYPHVPTLKDKTWTIYYFCRNRGFLGFRGFFTIQLLVYLPGHHQHSTIFQTFQYLSNKQGDRQWDWKFISVEPRSADS